MRVRISYVIEVSDEKRRAMRHNFKNDGGLASRQDIVRWYRENGTSIDDDLRSEHGACCWGDTDGDNTDADTADDEAT